MLLSSCYNVQKGTHYISPAGYNFSSPTIIHLKEELDEISGIAYYPKDSSLFAIQDEQGRLYKIAFRKKITINNWRFSAGADYEDIALHDSTFYILQGTQAQSSGNIHAVKFLPDKTVQQDIFQPPLTGRNSFETIYYDDTARRIVLICKDCADDGKKNISAYSFNPADNTFDGEPFFRLNIDAIANLLDAESLKFKPSAAAIHPLTGELYILSAVEKVLVIANRNGEVKDAFYLNPKYFKQPEGIAFAPNGDVFISNEYARIGAATILLYKYKPHRHEKD